MSGTFVVMRYEIKASLLPSFSLSGLPTVHSSVSGPSDGASLASAWLCRRSGVFSAVDSGSSLGVHETLEKLESAMVPA